MPYCLPPKPPKQFSKVSDSSCMDLSIQEDGLVKKSVGDMGGTRAGARTRQRFLNKNASLRWPHVRLVGKGLGGAPVDHSGLTVWILFVQKLISIRVACPSATHPLGPRINQNLHTDHPEVLTKYGLCGSSIKYGYETFMCLVFRVFLFVAWAQLRSPSIRLANATQMAANGK